MKIKIVAFVFLACTVFFVNAHEAHPGHQPQAAIAVSLVFDAQGTLWRTSVRGEFVVVDASQDMGKTFSNPVKVNPAPQKVGADGEARPKIAVSKEGNIYVTWTEALKKPFSGYVWFARSVDGGKTFEKPYIVHQDKAETTHRFDALNVAPDGKITVFWVDKRDLIAAKAAGKPYDGAAIYYAVSTDQGVSFAREQKLADSSCECCRIAHANKTDGAVSVMWRHVFPGSERDHMMAEIPRDGHMPQSRRVTFGRWKIDGCPHHGAALALGGEGKDWWGYHMAWFDGGNDDSGKEATLYYARMEGGAWASSPPKKFGNAARQAGHPALLAAGETVWLVWREKDAGRSQIWLMQSQDEGRRWGVPRMVVEVTGAADYPVLLQKENQALLLWNTEKALKVVPIGLAHAPLVSLRFPHFYPENN